MAPGWQIVDRPSEFGAVRSALTAPQSSGVVLVGAAGVGKTTLARAVTDSLRAALGRSEEAERVLVDATEHTGEFVALHEPQRTLAKACLAAAKGMERRAIELALAAADDAQRAGQYAVEAEALHHAARFGDRTVADRLAALTDKVHGSVVALQARHAAAVAAANPAELDAVSLDLERAGLLLSAADSAAQAAPLYDTAGNQRESIEAAARSLRLADQCGGATTPAVKIAARPLPLTYREREIAGLIAAGLTNKEIAEELTLSVRTVEGHVYRSCFKLGVADRDDLAELIRVEPLK